MLKKLVFAAMSAFVLVSCGTSSKFTAENVEKWSDKQVSRWYKQSEWGNIGLAPEVNLRELARQCALNPESWHAAYQFLTRKDLMTLEDKKYPLLDDGTFANIQTYNTKVSKGRGYELHKKVIDVQCVVEGAEIIDMGKLEDVIDSPKNHGEFVADINNARHVVADKDHYVIIFPGEPHKSGCMTGTTPESVHKVVIKVPYVK